MAARSTSPPARDRQSTSDRDRRYAMTTAPRAILAVARLAVIMVAMTACGTASSYLTPSGSTTTLMAGWERHFTIDWTVEPEQGGASRVRGHVISQHGEYADVGQRIGWVPGGVNGVHRAYCEIPHLSPAAH